MSMCPGFMGGDRAEARLPPESCQSRVASCRVVVSRVSSLDAMPTHMQQRQGLTTSMRGCSPVIARLVEALCFLDIRVLGALTSSPAIEVAPSVSSTLWFLNFATNGVAQRGVRYPGFTRLAAGPVLQVKAVCLRTDLAVTRRAR